MKENIKSHKQLKKKVLFFSLTIIFALVACGAVSADEYIGGQNLTTVQNGTVSGGVYVEAPQYTNSTNLDEHTFNLPEGASDDVQWARLYVTVYALNQQTDYGFCATNQFDGNGDGTYETTWTETDHAPYHFLVEQNHDGFTGNDNTAYGGGEHDSYKIINNHTIRVTSDYFMWYDVTDQITSDTVKVKVNTTGSPCDGRIKMMTLIVAYNDGDNDQIMYWVNQGQDVTSYLTEDNFGTVAVGSTTFNTSSITGTVESANLTVNYLASNNGYYGFPTAENNFEITGDNPPVDGTFTNSALDRTPDAQGAYAGVDSWNVTPYINGTNDVTLGYSRYFPGTGTAGYYKIPLAILTVNLANSIETPVSNFTANSTSGTTPLTVKFTDISTNNPTSWAWNFGDGTTSTEQNPTHTYTNTGNYTVKLTAINTSGSNTETKNNYITANPPVTTPVSNFTANSTSGTTPLTVKFTDTSTNNPTSWAWNFGDGTTSTEQNPTHTYTYTGNYTVSLTTTNTGGSDTEVKTDYIHIVNSSSQCDLTITGLVNPVPAGAVFAGQNNTVTVTGIKNQGTDTATNIPVYIYASDVNGGTTPVASTTIASLAAGATTTITIVDPTIRPITADTVYGSSNVAKITYIAVIDPYNTILETNKTNNNKTSPLKSVLYNGYGGQGLYEYNGTDINTKYTYDIRGDIVYHTQPESAYKGVGWTTRTETWNASDLSVPSTGTVEDVWLYLSYNWDYTADGDPNWTILFNGVDITNSSVAWYTDQSNFGAYANYKYGLMIFNVTSLYNRNGENNLIMNAHDGNLNALYPSTLAVVYSDPNATRKQIFIGEQCDELGLSQSSYGTTLEEATAYANFTGMTIDLANVTSATLHSFAGSAGPDEGNLLFNGNTIALAAWQGSSDTASALVANVKNYLTATGNKAAIQGTTSGGMDTLQQFLVVEYADAAPVANFTTNATTGIAPMSVQFNDTSTGYVASYAWDFNNDGITDSTDKNPLYTYSTPGTYNVKLTVTNSRGSDNEVKTGYITVNTPPVTDLIITDVKANSGLGDYMFANEPNVINVTVKNNGTAVSAATNVNVTVDGNTYTVNVPELAVGANVTVSVTDPVIHKAGDNVPVNANADPSNNVPETSDSNNIFATTLTVYNNGYKGKRYTDGSDLSTQQTFEGYYDIVYSSGNTAYNGAYWTEKTYSWTSDNLHIPVGATVVSARLYQGYTYDQMTNIPNWTMIFNGATINPGATYSDTKGYGSYNFPGGLYVYDVTSLFNNSGNTMTITPEAGNNYGIYGSYLIVVYQDDYETTIKKIYINDGFDMLYSGTTRSASNDEATAYATFTGVNTTNIGNAKVINILASANEDGKSKFIFNGNEYTGFSGNYSSGSQLSLSQCDVTSVLQNGLNTAGLQSFMVNGNGDNMVALSSILVAEYKPIVTANPVGGIYNHSLDVNLTSNVHGFIRYYIDDGSNPSCPVVSIYLFPVHLEKTSTLYFTLFPVSGINSDSLSETYIIDTTAPSVSANPTTCLVNHTLDVELTATEPSTIYYTTNGSDPTNTSNIYSGPIHIATTTTLKFMAVDAAGNQGQVQSETYTIDTTAPLVTADLNSGVFRTDQTVTLTASDDQDQNPIIYYSTDGVNWNHTTKTVTLNLNTEGVMNLRFYAVDGAGNRVTNQTRTYTLDKTAPTASATPGSGTYNTSQSVVLSATDNLDTNPVIYYTTNGSDPTTSSSVYHTALSISSTTILKFMAVDSAGNPSAVYTRNYTIPRADVYVNSSVSNSNPQVGDIITMTFKVGNNGPDNATGVIFKYVIPENFEYVGMIADSLPNPEYNPSTRTVTWNLGNLPVGDPKLNLILRVLSAGSSSSSPNIFSSTYDYITSNNARALTLNIQSPGSTVVNSSVSTPINAAENTSISSTVPMQETGTPFTGLIAGVLSILGGLGISRNGRKKKLPILLIIGVVFAMALCGTASADPYVGGDPPVTVQNGTVSGGVYSDTYYGFNSSGTPKDVNYSFQSLPENAQVVNATLYTGVYLGNMQTDYPTDVNVTFNGQQIDSQHLSSSYQYPEGSETWSSLQINDHTNRVTSDYLMWYDVTSLVQQNNIAHVVTSTSNFDGRIKFITLIVVYNDGDSDKIMYWVNQGHDADTSYVEDDLGEKYVGTSTFQSNIPTAATVNNAKLEVIHLASQDGKYTFNGNTVANSNPQGSYSGSNTWDVTSYFTNYGTNTLTYDRTGQFYKIVLEILTVNYTEPNDARSDLFNGGMLLPAVIVANQTYTLNTTINNGGIGNANAFQVKLYENNQEIGSQTVNGLAAGSTIPLSFSWKPTTLGTHLLQIIIDPDNQVDESNETNNLISKTLEVEMARADLVPENIVVPLNLTINQIYQLNTTIANRGYANSGPFVVKIYDNGQEIGSQTVNSLSVGELTNLLFNWTPTAFGSHNLTIVVDPANLVDEYKETNNEFKKFVLMKESGMVNVFIISDKPGTNILNMAALDILDNIQGLSIQLRNGLQIEAMSEDEIYEYLRTCDIFIGEWVMTNAEPKLTKILSEHPEVANKGVFLILEPPVSVTPASVALMKYSTINGVKLLENFSTDQLLSYYQNTMRGSDYNTTVEYMKNAGFPELFNKAVLYKNLNDKANLENQILWALSLLGLHTTYSEPDFSSGKQEYGIYRYQWYTLEEYIATYFKSERQGCVGLIESTMYVDAQELQPYYAIIDALEARGLNVIPVMAYGGTEEQLEVMLEYFTNATDINSFLLNPSSYLSRVDAIVSMPAYGMGGDNFTATTEFFDALGVPVFRAIHSDYVSNAEWDLSTSGLPTISGDKWWHIAIEEAQGEIDPTFVGGMSTVINNLTGASILGYVPQEENINSMADKIQGWVQLQYTVNALKKVALIYYNYPPGKNNIGASYLDPIQSILNLLNILKSQGYTVENIPVNATELEKLMLAQGINVANWAPGEVEKLADNPNVVLYSVDDYMAWFSKLDELTQLYVTQGPVAYIGELCKKAVQLGYTSQSDYILELNDKIDSWQTQILTLVPGNQTNEATPLLNNIASSLKNYVSTQNVSYWNDYLNYKAQFLALNVSGMSGWGEAPGDIMVVERNGKKYFVLPGIQFGNVFIGPEPQRGWEGDIDKLYHSTVVPPHHQYLAFFAWLQQQGTDAMVYIGRHATHEWLPGKEVILAPTDFPNIVTGSVPQIYFYISDGLAEGVQAKRRANAVIIDHLTPPMTYTSLYGGLAQLAQLAEDYDSANSTQKLSIISQIRDLIAANDFETGMGVDTDVLNGDDLIKAVNTYLGDIQDTLYPYGLDVIGEPWSDEQIALMVTSMLSVSFQTSGGGETTLQNEISLLFLGKTESALSATEKDQVQGLCVGVIKSLIYSNATAIAGELTSNPSSNFILALEKAKTYINLLNESVDNEIKSFLTAMNGGFVAPGPGGDPISNPDVLPTGRNFYQDQAAEIPTKEAYEYGKTLALLLLSGINESTNKVAIGIWCVETARDDGALVSMVLYLLGMEPQWSDSPSAGVNGQKLKEMPVYVELDDLVRPEGWSKKRIDAVIITSGLFRDLYSRQAGLLDNAFRIALARSYYTILSDPTLTSNYGDKLKNALDPIMEDIGYYGVGSESLNDNYVASDWVSDFEYYLSLNMTPEDAGEMAISKIFAPPEGDYGAGISKALEMSWTWNSTDDLARYYLERMGHIYSQNNWGTSNPAVFARALTGVTTMYTSRNTNLYGVLDNDDYVDYWGGLYNTLKYVNKGETINWNVIKYADRTNPKSVPIQQVISQEITTRYVNPNFIEGMEPYGYSGGRNFAKALDNFYKFTDIAPELTTAGEWNQWYNTFYGTSSFSQSIRQFMSAFAPFSEQKMLAKFIQASLVNAWNPSESIMTQLANALAQNIITNGVSCCDCVCGNIANMKLAMKFMSSALLPQFMKLMYAATGNEAYNTQQQQTSSHSVGSTQSASQSSGSQSSSSQSQSSDSGSSGSVGDEASESSSTPGDSGEGKAYEVTQQSSSSGASESGLPIAAIAGVIILVGLIGFGYFKGNFKRE